MRNILILLTAASFIPLAQANQTPNFFAGYQQSLTSCLADMDGAENPELALRQSGECAADSTVGFFFERGADVLSQHGKRVFGHGFHIQQSLDYSVAGDGKVRGDLDAVIPLMKYWRRRRRGEFIAARRVVFTKRHYPLERRIRLRPQRHAHRFGASFRRRRAAESHRRTLPPSFLGRLSGIATKFRPRA